MWGLRQFETYFGKIKELLANDGLALVHSIGRKGGPGQTGKWIRRYIFPGGYSPALSETLQSIERSNLWVTDIEILRLHYAKTLQIWEQRFQTQREKVAEMFDERFCRMWEFYLIGSVKLSSARRPPCMNFQVQLTANREKFCR